MIPQVSIVIPTFNSEATLTKTIQACLNQDYPLEKVEIIVVDDGSKDGTGDIVKKYPVRYVYQDNSGPAAARNNGWKISKGEMVCFTDSDCIPPKDWVSALAKNFASDVVGAAGGSYGIANPESLIADCIYQEIKARHFKMPGAVKALGSYNLMVRRKVLEEIGGFNQFYRFASGEDNDLSYRIIEKGYKLIFDKGVEVAHYHPTSLYKYLKTQFWHGFWRVKLYLEHPRMSSGDDYSGILDYLQPVQAVLVLLLSPLVFLSSFIRNLFFFLLLIEIILQLPMFLSILKNTGKVKYAPLVLITTLRSFSRGLGLCAGVFRFIIIRKKRR